MSRKVGLISDTHDNVRNVKRAVDVFNEEEVSYVLHAGDHVAPFVLRWFEPLRALMVGVYGNLDAEKELLSKAYENLGWRIHRDVAIIEVDRLKIALTHGTHDVVVEALAFSGKFDVVVRGHTHRTQNEVIGGTLVVNPGEACGYLSGEATIAILEVPGKRVKFVKL